jgi:predicted nucleic acid-binding protein
MSDPPSIVGRPAETAEPGSNPSSTHLDTSFLIKALVPGTREDRRLRQWIRLGSVIAMSSIGWAEFLCGPVSEVDRQRARKVVGVPLALAETEAERAAELFNVGGRRRGSLADCLIAATALKAGAGLATSNVGDFKQFEGEGLTIISAGVPAGRSPVKPR